MSETHPFGTFAPKKARHFLLGSFVTKPVDGYDFFYANKRNQFWPILEEVYGQKFPTRKEKEALFTRLGMAITDIILSCQRKKNSNLDVNLTNFVFNTKAMTEVLRKNKIETIFFSSRFVEKLFRRHFKDLVEKYPAIKLVTLPSPSPRYAAMTKAQKIACYKDLLPNLKS